jgi:hypothetical protein
LISGRVCLLTDALIEAEGGRWLVFALLGVVPSLTALVLGFLLF